MADTEGPRDLYRRWITELWNGDADAAADTAADLVTSNFVGHWPDRDVTGPRALADVVSETRRMFDQLSFVITLGPIVDGDLVAARWAGEGEGADGPQRFFGNDIVRVAGDKIAEYWVASAEGAPADQKEPGLAAVDLKADRKDEDDDSGDDSGDDPGDDPGDGDSKDEKDGEGEKDDEGQRSEE